MPGTPKVNEDYLLGTEVMHTHGASEITLSDGRTVDDVTIHYKGFYTDYAALVAAHAVGVDGDYADLGSTDTIWIWDTTTTAWVNSGSSSTLNVTRTNANTVDNAITITDGNTGRKIKDLAAAFTANSNFVHMDMALDQGISKYYYQATSLTADTVNDRRIINSAGGVLTYQRCTVANATKGAGTWVIDYQIDATGNSTLNNTTNLAGINANGNIDQLTSRYYYQSSSNTIDTVGDRRMINLSGALTFQRCTVAGGAKGTGTWVTDSIINAYGASNMFSSSKNNFRLSLTTGVPVTTGDVVAATTIYMTPYNGNLISLYNGTYWETYATAEISLALGALTNATLYDVFCYANSGVPTLEFLAWTNTTTRATALVLQDGILCKTGVLTRRYLGTFFNPGNIPPTAVTMTIASPCVVSYTGLTLYANMPVVFATSGALPTGIVAGTTYYLSRCINSDFGAGTSAFMDSTTFNISATPGGALINTSGSQSGSHTMQVTTYTEDSLNNRFLDNTTNKAIRNIQVSDNRLSWVYNTATKRQAHANMLNQFNFINGLNINPISLYYTVRISNTTAGTSANSSIGLDSYTTSSAGANVNIIATTTIQQWTCFFNDYGGLGLHFLSMIEFNNATSTCTWAHAGNVNGCGMYGQILH